ncbi:hypothetical protein [Methylomonas koyamae]|uniref:hypothetical protein n=1 Tax=Methylomonas koyamae TaxID=702114 RepID=UPI000AB15574|nr:hypothetical protein [Methylomonas koyamae]BBL56539.1 hypothetical protein MKFW12EY_01520 [Methylomonas koyamae]
MGGEFDSKKKLADLLRKDFKFITKNLDNDPSEFWSRTFIKTTVSLIEAEIFLLKQEILHYCGNNQIQLSPELLLFLNNKKYEINSSGQITERLLQVRVTDDIRFVFGQILSIKGHKPQKDFEDAGWSKVISTIAVRNRLTHPKSVDDMNISKQEVNDCKLAFNWCISNVVHYLDQEKNDIERRVTNLEIIRDKLINESSKDS